MRNVEVCVGLAPPEAEEVLLVTEPERSLELGSEACLTRLAPSCSARMSR